MSRTTTDRRRGGIRRGVAGIATVVTGVGLIIAALVSAPAAAAPQVAHPNAGDVWLSNSSTYSFPGHQNDPHLTGPTIYIWADGLTESSGSYVIDGTPPSGTGQQAWPASSTEPWSYDKGLGGPQVIDTVDVAAMIATADSNGDTPHAIQGYHFKLQFQQNPKKHKTFWVLLTETSPTPTPTATPTPTPTPTGSPEALTSTPAPSTPTPAASVLGVTTPSTGSASDWMLTTGLASLALGMALLFSAARINRRQAPTH